MAAENEYSILEIFEHDPVYRKLNILIELIEFNITLSNHMMYNLLKNANCKKEKCGCISDLIIKENQKLILLKDLKEYLIGARKRLLGQDSDDDEAEDPFSVDMSLSHKLLMFKQNFYNKGFTLKFKSQEDYSNLQLLHPGVFKEFQQKIMKPQ